MSTQIKVAAIPECDVCKGTGAQGVPAYADAKLRIGSWANVCREHFDLYHCTLGAGRGQEFVLRQPAPKPELTFDEWMRQVDRELAKRCGFAHSDLADFAYRDSYDDGCPAAEVAVEVLQDHDFPTDLL